MSNAAKHRKKAAEFEQLKQIDRAIASYVKAIEESESVGEDVDVALYNKVGDLALRQGRVPDAITYYERAVEHYATSGLFNNAIALCNKILRNAPGRANVYFTLGRISARKGLRGDATRNFLEYASRMQQDGRIEEGIRALAEVLDLMPELNDVRTMVEDLATRSGIALPRRKTPLRTDRVPTPVDSPAFRDQKSQNLVFLDVDYAEDSRRTPAASTRVPTRPPMEVVPTTAIITPLSAALITAPNGEDIERVAPASVDGLEANGAFVDEALTPLLDGVTPDEEVRTVVDVDPDLQVEAITWGAPPLSDVETPPLDEVTPEDFRDSTNDPAVVRAIYTQPPSFVPTVVPDANIVADDLVLERLDVESVPELDAAIAAGHELVEQAQAAERLGRPTPMVLTPIVPMTPVDVADVTDVEEMVELDDFEPVPLETVLPPVALPSAALLVEIDEVEELLEPYRPPFRIDPHDFILPGELPPLLLDDEFIDAGLSRASLMSPARVAEVAAVDVADDGGGSPALGVGAIPRADLQSALPEVTPVEAAESSVLNGHRGVEAADDAAIVSPATLASVDRADDDADEVGIVADDEADAVDDSVFDAEEEMASRRAVSVTPALPIAAVAEAATSVATSRRDSLRAAVARLPQNWLLRRRLAEALFEAGERDAALAELETAQTGLVNDGEFAAASDIADELVHVSPDRVPYHQKRVELAVRANDRQRLRFAYLDLADALVRMAEDGRARAVFARVLEIDPHDDRARAALGAAAPPPPPAPRPDDNFVDLADWLRDDDKPVDTRMRMREPAISGDEQADFESLLRHFKEGVSRSLGEDDFESHYDLGVAYKEMGLLDDAIAEFQKALRSRAHRLPAYEALGQCFVEQGRFQVAATVLTRALHEPGLDDDQRVGVLYLLAYSCEALQRRDEARSYFQRVYATDINFRDVAARLAVLEQASR
ncbi:tetratricopeptide repeat protein [Gemmatimonas sp.]|uniref:tetratricopeptide repeat protein n=1 Tax=Gemmatimonas sp. TaxID=1962908 RepID=UPI003F6F16FA